jgi:hypothetical protein
MRVELGVRVWIETEIAMRTGIEMKAEVRT